MSNVDVETLIDMALVASEAGDWDEAEKLSKQALEQDPNHYLAHKRLSLALWFKNQRSDALAEMEKCLELNPDFESGHYNLACFYAVEGHRDKALASLKKAIDLASYYTSMALGDPDFQSLWDDAEFKKLCGDTTSAVSNEPDSYYQIINGKKYDREMLELAREAVEGQGDGRISKADAEKLMKAVADANTYTDVEKATMAYIRGNFRWTDAADAWFRTEIRKWAATK